jgi:hypothetical protein
MKITTAWVHCALLPIIGISKETSWFSSSRRPVEEATTKNVDVKVIHSLTAVGFAINHETRAVFRTTKRNSQLLRPIEESPQQLGVVRLHDVPDVLFGYHQKMHRRLRGHVVKGEQFGILIDFPRRYFTTRDLAKNTIFHRHKHNVIPNPSSRAKRIEIRMYLV